MTTINYTAERLKFNSGTVQDFFKDTMYPGIKNLIKTTTVINESTGKPKKQYNVNSESKLFTIKHILLCTNGHQNLYQVVFVVQDEAGQMIIHTSTAANWIVTAKYILDRFNLVLKISDEIQKEYDDLIGPLEEEDKKNFETKLKDYEQRKDSGYLNDNEKKPRLFKRRTSNLPVNVDAHFELEQLDMIAQDFRTKEGMKVKIEAQSLLIQQVITELPGGLFSKSGELNMATAKSIKENNKKIIEELPSVQQGFDEDENDIPKEQIDTEEEFNSIFGER